MKMRLCDSAVETVVNRLYEDRASMQVCMYGKSVDRTIFLQHISSAFSSYKLVKLRYHTYVTTVIY